MARSYPAPSASHGVTRLRVAAHRRPHFLELPDATAQRQGRHLKVGVCADPAIFPSEELSDASQLRQLPLQAAQVLFRIAAFAARLDSADRVEQGARHVEQLLVLLKFVGVLEKGS